MTHSKSRDFWVRKGIKSIQFQVTKAKKKNDNLPFRSE